MNIENKIQSIVEKLIIAGIDMNVFLKASELSIREKIEAVTGRYYAPVKRLKYKRKPMRY